jgi:hypothetical protein
MVFAGEQNVNFVEFFVNFGFAVEKNLCNLN